MESKPAVLAIAAISIVRTRRTVIDSTTSLRESLSFTPLRNTSRADPFIASPQRNWQSGDAHDSRRVPRRRQKIGWRWRGLMNHDIDHAAKNHLGMLESESPITMGYTLSATQLSHWVVLL